MTVDGSRCPSHSYLIEGSRCQSHHMPVEGSICPSNNMLIDGIRCPSHACRGQQLHILVNTYFSSNHMKWSYFLFMTTVLIIKL